jgi:hypothetical protein
MRSVRECGSVNTEPCRGTERSDAGEKVTARHERGFVRLGGIPDLGRSGMTCVVRDVIIAHCTLQLCVEHRLRNPVRTRETGYERPARADIGPRTQSRPMQNRVRLPGA